MQHIDSGSTLRNFKLTISYDGRQFHGWQIQNNAMTVQEAFQTALSKIIGDDFDLKGCSRTDSGVHANMYCISLKTSKIYQSIFAGRYRRYRCSGGG